MRRIMILGFSALFLSMHPAVSPAKERILIVHSYHDTYDWVQGVNKGFDSVLSRPDLDIEYFYMDTKRNPGKDWKLEAGRLAKSHVDRIQPEVVIAVDDNAQAYFASAYKGKIRPQIVFCGVNSDPEKYGYLPGNTAGILERTYLHQVLTLLKQMIPQAKTIAYISDDSATSDEVMARTKVLAENGDLPLRIVDFYRPSTFPAWKKTIEACQADRTIDALLIPLYHTVKKDETIAKSMAPKEVMKWTTDHTRIPIVGFWPFSPADGALFAVAVNPVEHGRVAGLMAMQLLAGKSPKEVGIITNKDGFVIINVKTAQKLGLNVPFDMLRSADRVIY